MLVKIILKRIIKSKPITEVSRKYYIRKSSFKAKSFKLMESAWVRENDLRERIPHT